MPSGLGTALVPRFVVSHTVVGVATFAFEEDGSGTVFSFTIPPGEYWTDPVYGGAIASDAVGLVEQFAHQLNTGSTPGGQVATLAVITHILITPPGGIFCPSMSFGGDLVRFRGDHSSVTAAGRDVAVRLGIDPLTPFPAGTTSTVQTKAMLGAWDPNKPETGAVDDFERGDTGNLVVTDDGTVHTTFVSNPVDGRIVRIGMMPGTRVHPRNRVPDFLLGSASTRDDSLRTHLYAFARRGEKIRYYEDGSLQATYLTADMSATADTVSLFEDTGVSVGTVLCVDGERMQVSAGASSPWTVRRTEPRAHAKYAVCTPDSFNATYTLSEDSGNVNRGSFDPIRRGIKSDFHNVEIGLVRARA